MSYLSFNGKKYDFNNTGYKIHLPVVPNSRDPLTREIANYLDQKFGLTTCFDDQYEATFYKVGCGGELEDGKGITIYGRSGSKTEMKELSEEIEKKFGKELAKTIKKYNIKPSNPLQLTASITGRFAAYGHSYENDKKIFDRNYSFRDNKSGALPLKEFTTIFGDKKTCPASLKVLKSLSDIDQKFFHGECTMYAVDTFGELFTGKIEAGKIPQPILDGLPDEYRAIKNLTDKNIIDRINKGTTNIVAAMLKDLAINPKSKIRNASWLTSLDAKVIDDAMQLFAKYDPEAFKILEQKLPDLVEKSPTLVVLKKTPTLTKIKNVDNFSDGIAKMFDSKTKLSKLGKVGLCIAGVTMLTTSAISVFNQDKKNILFAEMGKTCSESSLYPKTILTNSKYLTI